MKTNSRLKSLAAIGGASTAIVVASVPSIPAVAEAEADAELFKLIAKYNKAAAAQFAIYCEWDEARSLAWQHHPNPPASIVDRDHGERVALTAEKINAQHDALELAEWPENEAHRQRRLDLLAKHDAICEAIDKQHGIDVLNAKNEAACAVEAKIFDAILATPATTFAGFLAKLTIANRYDPIGADYSNGWGTEMVLSVLRDAERVGSAIVGPLVLP